MVKIIDQGKHTSGPETFYVFDHVNEECDMSLVSEVSVVIWGDWGIWGDLGIWCVCGVWVEWGLVMRFVSSDWQHIFILLLCKSKVRGRLLHYTLTGIPRHPEKGMCGARVSELWSWSGTLVSCGPRPTRELLGQLNYSASQNFYIQ